MPFIDHTSIPPHLWRDRIFPLLSNRDLSAANQTSRFFYNESNELLLNRTRLERYEYERKRILEAFAHPLEPGSQIKFIVRGENAPRTGTIVRDDFHAGYREHRVTVLEQGDRKRFSFRICDDLQTICQDEWQVAGLPDTDDEEELANDDFVSVAIINNDLVTARENYNTLKQQRVGPKLAKFSEELSAGTPITLTFTGGTQITLEVQQDTMIGEEHNFRGYNTVKQYAHETEAKDTDNGDEYHLRFCILDDMYATLDYLVIPSVERYRWRLTGGGLNRLNKRLNALPICEWCTARCEARRRTLLALVSLMLSRGTAHRRPSILPLNWRVPPTR